MTACQTRLSQLTEAAGFGGRLNEFTTSPGRQCKLQAYLAAPSGAAFLLPERLADWLNLRGSTIDTLPGAYYRLGIANGPGLHNPGYAFDASILPLSAALLARLVEVRSKAR